MQNAILFGSIVPRVLLRAARGRYDARSRAFLRWCALKAPREQPRTPPRAAHFHFNVLDTHRNGRAARLMVLEFLDMVKRRGVGCVYGQMEVYEKRRRSERVFRRFGFHCIDRKPFTKFRHLDDRPVYLATFVCRLDGTAPPATA